MAQAIFDEHPLESYLKSASKPWNAIPGGSPTIVAELDISPDISFDDENEEEFSNHIEIPKWLMCVIKTLSHIKSSQSSSFAERFKYDVISSSLLSDFLQVQAPHTAMEHFSHALPGMFDMNEAATYYWVPSIAFVLCVTFGSAGYIFLVFIIILLTVLLYTLRPDQSSKLSITSTLNTLNDLITAGYVWDSVVHETLASIENDEHHTNYGLNIPSSPISTIRVALQSSLHITQSQCDNIRQLLTALTSHSALCQLSEMYAPQSPRVSSTPTLPPRASRPFSMPHSSDNGFHPSSPTAERRNKHATWNGSYAALAHAGSPTNQVLMRREKRRSDLSWLLQSSASLDSLRYPISPSQPSPPLHEVDEEYSDDDLNENPDDFSFPSPDTEYKPFGSTVLYLHRKRRSCGLEAFGLPDRSRRMSVSTQGNTLSSATSSTFSGSRFTAIQPPRHPLSLSALNSALESALSAKRHACSHLLALRFEEEEGDEIYWDNVRSLMELLTNTLSDASARLTEALELFEGEKLKIQNPSPESIPSHSREVSLDPKRVKTMTQITSLNSFAPLPSYLTRFAANVDAISTALNDARDNLEQCVASLKDRDEQGDELSLERRNEHPALLAYGRLRQEIGLALRECERGRERLFDILSPPRPQEDFMDDLPGLGHDTSEDSDKVDNDSMSLPEEQDLAIHDNGVVVAEESLSQEEDVTAHLKLMSQRLPPPGVEQVFEGDSSVVEFGRVKSKLSREERICLMKERRASGGGLGLGIYAVPESGPEKMQVEKWGPSGEVVQELKDVIWKVSERRRRMAEEASSDRTL